MRGQQLADEICDCGEILSEGTLRQLAYDIGLKLTYRRPWADIAEQAFFRLVAELVDFRRIDPAMLIETGICRFCDERLTHVELVARPQAWISHCAFPNIGTSTTDWINEASATSHNFALEKVLGDEYVCLCEYSDFRWHDWDRERETRISVCEKACDKSRVLFMGPQDPLLDLPEDTSDDYARRMSRAATIGDLVVGGYSYRLRVGPQRWFAIHPLFAEELSLRPTPDVPFAWIDEHGDIAAKSIRWRDGPGDRDPPRFADIFGSGWLVLLRRSVIAKAGLRLNVRVNRCMRRMVLSTHSESKYPPCLKTSSEIVPITN
jgi:hypothetical protein